MHVLGGILCGWVAEFHLLIIPNRVWCLWSFSICRLTIWGHEHKRHLQSCSESHFTSISFVQNYHQIHKTTQEVFTTTSQNKSYVMTEIYYYCTIEFTSQSINNNTVCSYIFQEYHTIYAFFIHVLSKNLMQTSVVQHFICQNFFF